MKEKNIFGNINDAGEITSWPEADLNGHAVERTSANRAQVDATRFVVLPQNVEFTDDLKEALVSSGYEGLLKWREVAAPPVIGFTEIPDEPREEKPKKGVKENYQPPPQESFGKKQGE